MLTARRSGCKLLLSMTVDSVLLLLLKAQGSLKYAVLY